MVELSSAAVVGLLGRVTPELSASSPTGAALAGGLGYLAVRACRARPA
jgi:hypothetical protein